MIAVDMAKGFTICPLEGGERGVASAHGCFSPVLETVVDVGPFSEALILRHVGVVVVKIEVAADAFLSEE
jgi:hypothetical protein